MNDPKVALFLLTTLWWLTPGLARSALETPDALATKCAYITESRISYKIDYLEKPFDAWIEEWARLNTRAGKFGHEVERGSQAVLIVEISQSGPGVDNVTVTSLTFEVSPVKSVSDGQTFTVPVNRDSYTFGSPAFFSQGSFFSGHDQIPSIKLEFLSATKVKASVNADLVLTRPETNKGGSLSLKIDTACIAPILRQADFKGLRQVDLPHTIIQ